MVKLTCILSSFLILAQSLGFHANDLAELDELFNHAKFHQETYGDNFLVFMAKHYGDLKAEHEKEHREEKKDHEKLPFQHHCHSTTSSTYVIRDFSTNFLKIQVFEVDETHNFFYSNSYHSLEVDEPFQPPRVA